jgi:hypothetical protein
VKYLRLLHAGVVIGALVASCGSASGPPLKGPANVSASVGALTCPNLASANDANVPAVVLYERNPWLMAVGTDFPTVALWRDGLIVFIHEAGEKLEVRQANISPTEAARIIGEVGSWTRGVPAYTEVFAGSDATTVEIVIHDGDSWRVADVYGLSRDGVPAPVEFVMTGSAAGTIVEHPEQAPKVPGRFMDAYRTLLAVRPKDSGPFEPTDIEVLFWGFDNAEGEPVPWPTDVPPPPADAVPGEREPGDPISYSFVVASKHWPALQHMVETANVGKPTRAIGFNGHKWTVSPMKRFRGQDAINRVLHCNRKPDEGVRVPMQ